MLLSGAEQNNEDVYIFCDEHYIDSKDKEGWIQ